MSGGGVGSGLEAPGESTLAGSASQPEMYRRCRLVVFAVVVAAGGLAVSLLVARANTWSIPGSSFLLASTAVAIAQMARIRIRVGADYVLVAWGEVATIAALCLIPALWVPLAGAVGAVVAHVDRLILAGPRQRMRVPFAICSLTIASTAAAAIVAIFYGIRSSHLQPSALPAIAVLVLAAFAYFGVSTVLAAAWVADDRG